LPANAEGMIENSRRHMSTAESAKNSTEWSMRIKVEELWLAPVATID